MKPRRVIAVGCAALAVGLAAGVGAGGALAGHDGRPAGRPGRAGTRAGHTNTFLHGRSGVITTATVPTQPTVTALPAATTPATATTQQPGYGKPAINVGDMNTPEQLILGSLYALALQQQGYTVITNRNIGAVSVAQGALKQGSLDLYPQYLNVWNSDVAGLHHQLPTLQDSYAAGAAYASRHGMVLLPPTPLSDTGALAVFGQYAAANHVTSISSLAHGSGVILAAQLGFLNASSGLTALEHAYGVRFRSTEPVDIGSQWWWLRSANAQVAYVNTTDPQLLGREYRLLQDPKHFFGFGNVVPVTTPRVLKAEGPAFAQAIEAVDALLTTSVMRGLNAEDVVYNHNYVSVASEFLQGAGILPMVQYAQVTSTGTTTTATAATTTTNTPITTTATPPTHSTSPAARTDRRRR